jgi:catechol 2,3-dioxygenase-like lactoylglutathione lyase family enzyme
VISGVSHLALRVSDLREAADYYRDLLDLDVAFREAETDDGWATLPAEAAWDESPVELEMVMLHRDGFRLALERVDDVGGPGLLSHVGLEADAGELERLRGRVDPVLETERIVIFHDRYGVRWELSPADYGDPATMSSGARTGRWLEAAAR